MFPQINLKTAFKTWNKGSIWKGKTGSISLTQKPKTQSASKSKTFWIPTGYSTRFRSCSIPDSNFQIKNFCRVVYANIAQSETCWNLKPVLVLSSILHKIYPPYNILISNRFYYLQFMTGPGRLYTETKIEHFVIYASLKSGHCAFIESWQEFQD